ncbi:hypothetical protein DFJ63DRAFT_193247 [Scheffersomyces coipomensis]|uniref:uncharacterized protein n=1 Tax=Scheffersomyces coipomensis TaxID=1788519 RepID=UPI00315DFE84
MMTAESLVDLPDDILYQIYQYLNMDDLKNLVLTNKSFIPGIYDQIYRHGKYIITFDDGDIDGEGSSNSHTLIDEDEEEEDDEYFISDDDDDDDDDNESLDNLDSDFYFDDFDEYYDTFYDEPQDIFFEDSDDEEDINNGQDEVVIIRNSARWTPPPHYYCASHKRSSSSMGLPIRLINDDQDLIDHINRFKHFNITISITNFNEIINKLNKYESLLKKLFSNEKNQNQNQYNNNQNNNKKEIKIFIKLDYTFQSFNDVKDCLTNVNRLIYYFDQSEPGEDQDGQGKGGENKGKKKHHQHRHRVEQVQDDNDDNDDEDDTFNMPKQMYNKIQIDLAINHYNSSANKAVG